MSKALTLWQPWATLVVLGAKVFETRSWNTKYRGELFIHAGKRFDYQHRKLAESYPFNQYIKNVDDLPLGKVIGRVELIATYTSQQAGFGDDTMKPVLPSVLGREQAAIEWQFGDYSPGRYAWQFKNAVPFQEKDWIEMSGGLSLWNFDMERYLM